MHLSLTDHEVKLLEAYALELKKWNSKVNLTAIIDDQGIAIKHFLDSLMLAPYIKTGDCLLDIGSGAGLPIIPLKIIRSEIPMVSVDAVAKKIHFQRHIIRLIDLQHIEALHARIENLHSTHGHQFSVITSRAFTRLDRFVMLAAPLLADDGVMIAMKARSAEGEISESIDAINDSGFMIASVESYSLPLGMGERVLTFIKKR
jgi:16S rRNA (guanine527-N7)-methyltransferase